MGKKDSRILGDRVYLRKMIKEDTPYIVEWRNDPDIQKWMFNQDKLTIEGHLNWFRKQTVSERIDFIICDIKNDTPIGTVNFINMENGKAEAGKMLGNKEYWGGGYAKEAFCLWIKYGFDVLEFKKIHVRTMVNNIANIKLNEKLGFTANEEITVSNAGRTFNVVAMELNHKDLK